MNTQLLCRIRFSFRGKHYFDINQLYIIIHFTHPYIFCISKSMAHRGNTWQQGKPLMIRGGQIILHNIHRQLINSICCSYLLNFIISLHCMYNFTHELTWHYNHYVEINEQKIIYIFVIIIHYSLWKTKYNTS